MHASEALQRLKASRAARQLAAGAADADSEPYVQQMAGTAGQLSNPGAAEAAGAGRPGTKQPCKSSSLARAGAAAPPSTLAAAGAKTVVPSTRGGRPAVATAASTQQTPLDTHWKRGPDDPAGLLIQLSERPLLCSAALWPSQQVVVGSSDHALYVVDVKAGRCSRTLYSKTCGHTEWVACVAALPGGRLLSGGMDGQLWLWPAGSGSSGHQVKAAHEAPVSQVAALAGAAVDGGEACGTASGLAVSCSYDKTVKVWDAGPPGNSSNRSSGSRVRQAAVLRGHQGPVLQLAVQPWFAGSAGALGILTGDRSGSLMCWDLKSSSSSWGVAGAHQGHVTSVAWLIQHATPRGAPAVCNGSSSSWCGLSGGQDGWLRVWDGRSGAAVAAQAVHADPRGKGAVGNIITGIGHSRQLVVTAGADHTLAVLDPAMSWRPVHRVQLPDFPYSLIAGPPGSGLAVCGCGDGSVHLVDVEQGRTLYALGAGKAGAIRAMELSEDKLVCAGDDGNVMLYSFSL